MERATAKEPEAEVASAGVDVGEGMIEVGEVLEAVDEAASRTRPLTEHRMRSPRNRNRVTRNRLSPPARVKGINVSTVDGPALHSCLATRKTKIQSFTAKGAGTEHYGKVRRH